MLFPKWEGTHWLQAWLSKRLAGKCWHKEGWCGKTWWKGLVSDLGCEGESDPICAPQIGQGSAVKIASCHSNSIGQALFHVCAPCQRLLALCQCALVPRNAVLHSCHQSGTVWIAVLHAPCPLHHVACPCIALCTVVMHSVVIGYSWECGNACEGALP